MTDRDSGRIAVTEAGTGWAFAEALEQLEHARRLDPLHPPRWDFYIGRALVHLGRDEEALPWLAACARRAPAFGWQRYRAAALAHLGRLDEAHAVLADPAATNSYGSIGEIHRFDPYVEGTEPDRSIDGLRAAGFPE